MGTCAETTGVIVIGITNFFVMLASILSVIAGIIIAYFPVNDVLGMIEKETKDKMAAIHSQVYQSTSDDYIYDWHLNKMFGSVCLAMAVGGFVVFCISFVGCIGAVCRLKIPLLIYSLILGLIAVAQLVEIGVLYTDNDVIIKNTESYLSATIESSYKGEYYPSNDDTLSWNFVMIYYKCCGVNDYMDFNAAEHWSRGQQTMPVYCCDPIPESNYKTECTNKPVSGNYEKGCFKKAKDTIMGNMTLFVVGFLGSMLIEVVLIVFTCILYTSNKKNKVGDSSSDTSSDSGNVSNEPLPAKF